MRDIKEILKEMDEMGLSPETIDQEINDLKRVVFQQIVNIDKEMTPTQISEAFAYLYSIHCRRPIENPVSISRGLGGGFVINEGDIVGLSKSEVAERHCEKLLNGNKDALNLNEILCGYQN